MQPGFEAGFLKAEYQIVQLITDRKTTGANDVQTSFDQDYKPTGALPLYCFSTL
ncbi:hypothetical protein PM8797T_10419 [Gimesia maris DSM 8797]|nr:hypothetical protein PM8797T_10419 [Gimesia maris DSM 8797]